ncbi:methyltransferase domain-containing protein [Poritiphilus flavus]|uniref:Methyltransferase domain-containing protein n=1 Tax=Poritiphilus flavus TaxID=2697053 RepID=A0A6L9EFW5_9FLAO|nr:methyltransferase domain-containing protein [Poritiphilus flavus]NAS13179.1 methyltransferase domain-containing protein [Poritiphilus flavus]
MSFVQRTLQKELMDDPKVPAGELKLVLKDIDFANRALGGNRITIKALQRLFKAYPERSYSILDAGCGDGTMMRLIATFCRNQKIEVQLTGWDLSETAVTQGKRSSKDFPEINLVAADILKHPCPPKTFDFVITTLTMHHFEDDQLELLLKRLTDLARKGVVINDLHRNRLAYALFKGFSSIFIRTRIARHDGLVSIRRGFRRKELERLSANFPEMDHKIQWKWAFRWLWILSFSKQRLLNE